MNDQIIEQKLSDLGFIIKSGIKFNKFVNCAHISKPTKKDAVWYRVDDDKPFVSYGSWNGCIDDGYFFIEDREPNKTYTEEEKRQFAIQKAEREKIEAEAKQLGLENMRSQWDKAYLAEQSLGSHPYLAKKKIPMMKDFRSDFQKRLLIPMYNHKSQIMGFQRIDDDGVKMFAGGSQPQGSFYPILAGTNIPQSDVIYLVEGVATGLSLHQILNNYYDDGGITWAILCCFSAGQIPNVANLVRKLSPNKTVIVAADNDKAGIEAAQQSGYPYFIIDYREGKDVNDVVVDFGIEKAVELFTFCLNDISKD